MDLVFMLSMAVFAVMVVAILLMSRRRPPGWRQRFLTYLFLFPAVGSAYTGYTAHQRKSWWFVPPLIFLIIAIREFVRQRKIAKTGHANAYP
jgi:uncharacterized membrane protein